MDGSRRSAHGNAYFAGFGKSKRIVFFDTLLSRLAAPEVEAVLAHELGHFKLRHIIKRMALSAVLRLVSLGRYPTTVDGDGAAFALLARRARTGTLHDPFTTAYWDQGTLFAYVQGFSARLFGDTVPWRQRTSLTSRILLRFFRTNDEMNHAVRRGNEEAIEIFT